MTKQKTSFAALFLILLLSVAGCSQLPALGSQPSESLESQAAARLAQQDYSAAAQLFRLAGESAQEPRRSALLLEAADAASRTNNPELTQQLINRVNPDALDARGQAYFELLQVQVLIADKSAAEALELLPPPSSGSPPDVAAKVWALRSELFADDNQPIAAVHALVQRDVWLLDEQQVKENDERIWQLLKARPPAADANAAEGDDITQGWLKLARIDAQQWEDRGELERELRRWERLYSGHPAARNILPEHFEYAPTRTADGSFDGTKIGLALPLTGNFSSASAAIQDGFLAGYYASKKDQPSDNKLPTLRIYDTNALSDANRLIQNASADGISVLVGPLQKGLATELSQRTDLGIPVLALNYTESPVAIPNFYQFGLAPEDEARAAAKRALAMGLRTAIVLVPDGDWGARILEAFRDAFNAEGGDLIDYATFDPKAQDHAKPIKRVLRYGSASGDAVKTGETSRRRDVDFIFIAAQPAQARQIRQQLRFFYASRLPVLATSHVFSGTPNRSKDSDLEGLKFADMPWIIGNSPVVKNRREQVRELWPAIDKLYPRLFAMGYDAWLLVERLNAGGFQSGLILQGNTGDLYLQDDGRIQRDLIWAEFSRGKPKALPDLAPQPAPSQPVSY